MNEARESKLVCVEVYERWDTSKETRQEFRARMLKLLAEQLDRELSYIGPLPAEKAMRV